MTLPPGELMYKCMGLDESSASRKSSCETSSAESVSRIYRERVRRVNSEGGVRRETYGPVEHDYAFAQQAREDIVAALAAALLHVRDTAKTLTYEDTPSAQ